MTLCKQCSMARKVGVCSVHRVEWIPVKFAVVGKVLKLRNMLGVWEDGWMVETANGEAQEPPDNFAVQLPSLDPKTMARRR